MTFPEGAQLVSHITRMIIQLCLTLKDWNRGRECAVKKCKSNEARVGHKLGQKKELEQTVRSGEYWEQEKHQRSTAGLELLEACPGDLSVVLARLF